MGGYELDESFFAPAEAFAPGILQKLVATGWPNDVVLNLNFPAGAVAEITTVEVTRQGFRDMHVRHAEKRTDLRGRDYYWIGFRQERSSPPEGTDLRALYEGRISVTPLHIDLTHLPTVRDLKAVLGGPPPGL
jgi:5'-nucleotidase